MSRRIPTAKTKSICSFCGRVIDVGDKMTPINDKGKAVCWLHPECAKQVNQAIKRGDADFVLELKQPLTTERITRLANDYRKKLYEYALDALINQKLKLQATKQQELFKK